MTTKITGLSQVFIVITLIYLQFYCWFCKRFDICYICLFFFYYYIDYLVINEDMGEKQMKVVNNTILR